jgi:hypothetical protein
MTERPGYPPDHILRGLSLPRRVGYVVAGLGGLVGVAMVGMLWATEPTPLPARTQLAFAGLIVVGVAWAAFAGWALARRPLFAIDRLIAAALAVGFSTLTTLGAVAVALARSSTAGVLAGSGLGLTLIAIATTMLVRARAHRAALLAFKRELEEPSAPSSPDPAHNENEAATMSTRNRLPIGPLALAMRHHRGGSPGRRIAIAALILGLALVAGVALLLR